MFSKRFSSGFTLIELLVVIAIIATLSTMLVTNLDASRKKSRDAKRATDLKTVQLALESYYGLYGEFPNSSTFDGMITVLSNAKMIKTRPSDPVNLNEYQYQYVPLAKSGGSGTRCSSYHMAAVLEYYEGEAGPLKDDSDEATGGVWLPCAGGSNFEGQSLECDGTQDTIGDMCYDLVP